MSLTANNLALIKAIAKNDMYAARKAALASLEEDTSKKNADSVAYYKNILQSAANTEMPSIPTNMQGLLIGEAPSGFDATRYYARKYDASVVNDIMFMKLVADEMTLRKIPYKNTTLLYGESGTGKTELGRYIAYKLNLPFFYVSFVSTIESYMGSTAKNMHKIFEFCNTTPCVLMLDEIDCVAAKRSANGSKGADGELERTTITLMQELDRLPNHVTLIAATNRVDMLDEAILRRFSIKHCVQNMTLPEREEMTRQYLRATNTEQYVSETFVATLIAACGNPGELMPELIKEIGRGIFKEKASELLAVQH